MEHAEHRHLDCGIELVVLPIAGRRVVALEIRAFAGCAFDAPEYLGTARVLSEAITKGTARRDGRALNDAFDELGASHGNSAGRETVGFSCLCLPESFDRAVELHAELIRTPSFPDDACTIAVELTRQALVALPDDPGELTRKLLHLETYGEPLGRHVLGEAHTLAAIGREQIVEHWRHCFRANRMQVGVAGAVEPRVVADTLERHFAGFDPAGPASHAGSSDASGTPVGDARHHPPSLDRPELGLDFKPGRKHFDKDVEQVQIAICFPGAAAADDDLPVEQVLVQVLSGGMSSRLWTSIRERQGLVYWVGAWSDRPRLGGMVHLGASTTPQNVEQVYDTLLRELDGLGDNVTPAEIERAVTGLTAQTRTHGDLTRSRASHMVNDLFYHGRPIPIEDKLARIRAVTADDIRQYLDRHPRDRLGVVTLGPGKTECET